MTIFRIVHKFRQILSRHQKIRILELGVIMIIGGFMEMLSVSLIVPFMNAIINSESMMGNSIVQFVCGILNIRTHRGLMVFLSFIMAVLYILKNVFLVFQLRIQNRFVTNNRFMTQQRLFNSYLSRPYEFFLGVNSGEVLRIINQDTSMAFSLLSSLLTLFSELVVSGILIITILVISPGITLGMAIILFGMTFFILKVIRPTLRNAGRKRQTSATKMNQWILQAIQGIKELKILGKENFFKESFRKDGQVFVQMEYKRATLSLIPRFLIEATAMSSLFLVVGIMIYNGAAIEDLVPILSSVAVASIRLLPSVNRISQSIGEMSYGEPMLDKMIENLKQLDENEKKEKPEQRSGLIKKLGKTITMEDISYRYPKGEKDVLSNSFMKIERGSSIGIVGSSGAGKTTAVDIMLGLLKPQKGKVLIDGTDITLDMDGWLSDIGYIPQQIFMLNGNIRQNVAFGVPDEEISDEKVWTALKEASLDNFVRSLPDGLFTELGERGVRLSGGQRQRVGIARALYNDPSVLFFDEATSALDNETEAAIMDSINHLHRTKTMIIIAHRLTTIEGCDHVFRVENGKITRER